MLKAKFKNLGPIKDAEIELNDLTIIAGKNNSGKTYASYAIYGFLKNLHSDPYFKDIEVKDGIDIAKIAGELSQKGTTTAPMTDVQFKELKENIIGALSDSYSDNLHRFFSSPKQHFKDTAIHFNMNGSPFKGAIKTYLKKDNENVGFISIEHQGGELTFNLSITKDIPNFLISSVISNTLINLLFDNKSPFVITAERFGISLFYKDLDVAKNRVVEMLQKMENDKIENVTPFDVLAKFSSRYAEPIQDNIDYIRGLSDWSKETSEINTDKLFDYIKNMMDAYYRVDENEIRLISKKRKNDKFDIPLHLASSSARGFANLYFFLKCTAKKGQLLIIDEPESHLNPENQIHMARLLAMCVSAGLKVLVTTHSDYFIKEINNLVMLSNISDTTQFLKKHGEYKTEMFLSEKKVSGYICENGGMTKCNIDEFGLDMHSFDDTIIKINQVSRDLTIELSGENDG